jgi:hypothetical protein
VNWAAAPALASAMTALALAPKFISFVLKRVIAALFSNTISSLHCWPPIVNPSDPSVSSA